jgi:putative oxidoreductase
VKGVERKNGMTVTTNIALLIFRTVIGCTLAAYGAQKLFGWFGGPGSVGMSQILRKQGYKPVWFWVSLAIVGELGGGLSFALDFLTPLGAAGIFGAMVMATRTHWKNGFFLPKSGYEYALTQTIASLTIGLTGPEAMHWTRSFTLHCQRCHYLERWQEQPCWLISLVPLSLLAILVQISNLRVHPKLPEEFW